MNKSTSTACKSVNLGSTPGVASKLIILCLLCLPPLPAKDRLRTPQNTPKSDNDTRRRDGLSVSANYSFSSTTVHSAFATTTICSRHEHKIHERFDLTVLRIFGVHRIAFFFAYCNVSSGVTKSSLTGTKSIYILTNV